MSLKHLAPRILAVLVVALQLCTIFPASAYEAADVVKEPLIEASYEYGDLVIDMLIEQELDGAHIPFAQREIFTMACKTALRRDANYPKNNFQQDLIEALLKEQLKQRFKPYANNQELAQTLYALSKIFLKINMAIIGHQIMRLEPFVWQTPQQLMENRMVIAATQKQLDSWNQIARLQGQIAPPPSHLFNEGPAYRQLMDISRHGWDRSLNWDPTTAEQPGLMTEQNKDDTELAEDFSDVNDNLNDAVSSSDQAMDQFHEDMEASGTTKLLEATAQENVELTDKMQQAEDTTVKANIKALAIGVMVGAAGTAVGMAMQSAPAMRTGSYGHAAPTPSASPATHVLKAPSMGGSFDGAAGQTLFTRF